MEKSIKVCLDMVFPEIDPYEDKMPLYDPKKIERREMAVERDKRWEKKSINLYFMNGDPLIQEKVQKIAKKWESFANLKLNFVNDPKSEIRIAFKWVRPETGMPDTGSWSLIGTDAVTLAENGQWPIDRPTMNYGWLEQNTSEEEYTRVVLHECGHMLGAIHEHQNPAAGIPWDREAVYRWHEENHTGWDRERINHNYFERYNKNIMNYTNYDDKSIMVYPIPSQFTTTHQSYGNWPDGNSELSETDKEFIKAQYPFSSG